ncbi:sigma-54-dependent Fis family transcriptional regulator [Flammeovirga pectinis]|uniref:Sigma-54-dependent Fis family transcriptional regulator n=1 Tax=Flammeovirga pectinis TaxID=2494373 RepID=A0A3Q9FR75_9BACT|nr:sigma-54 dependent transcriptional regulator [Flammeovirga pectinis]AZQ64151.1 sigma-54-dependent Fis family transcriptional regulator [Flammeovirga pectinis]
MGNLLIIDDNISIHATLEIILEPYFDKITALADPQEIMKTLAVEDYQVVLLDMNFSPGLNTGAEGIRWLKKIKETYPAISVVMMTAYGHVELAVESLKIGASDFILKPWENRKLLATLQSALQLSESKNEIKELKQKAKALRTEENIFPEIIGESAVMKSMMSLIEKVGMTDTNILITGENGTGKELVAKAIHHFSKRNQEQLVEVDMGAVSETLFESELFGHVKGAFTDAHQDRIGKFELANKGSLFLDEIGNLSFSLQAKLLAALQNRQITKVGGNKVIPIDIRLISATNKNLFKMVENEEFRQDLLYRINTIQIEVPALRERGDDIVLLANHFKNLLAKKYDKGDLQFSESALDKLTKYHWPGNVRELQHTIERAVILTDSIQISAELIVTSSTENTDVKTLNMADMEEMLIKKALKRHPQNISAAAGELGVTRQTLYNKMKKLGLS